MVSNDTLPFFCHRLEVVNISVGTRQTYIRILPLEARVLL